MALAFIAAIMLVFQTLGSGWANAVPTQLDAFGNPLCISNGVQGGGSHSGGKANLENCCTLACNGWASSLLPPPDAVLPGGAFRLISEQLGNPDAILVFPAAEKRQGNPRAPPVSV